MSESAKRPTAHSNWDSINEEEMGKRSGSIEDGRKRRKRGEVIQVKRENHFSPTMVYSLQRCERLVVFERFTDRTCALVADFVATKAE